MFLLPLFKPLNIHSHTYSLDFCLYKLETSYSFFESISSWSHFVPHLSVLLRSEFSLEAKRSCDGWILMRNLQGNCFTGGHWVPQAYRINLLKWRWDSCIYGQKRLEVLEGHQDLPIWPHPSLQNSIPSQSMPLFTSRYSVRFGIQFVL